MVVKHMHHGNDLVEHRTREASFGAQCTNHSANSMCPGPLLECIIPRQKHRRTVKTGTEVFISYNAVSDPGVVDNEVRTKSSATHTVGFLSTIIERQKAKTGYQFWLLDMTLTNCLVLQLFTRQLETTFPAATRQLEN